MATPAGTARPSTNGDAGNSSAVLEENRSGGLSGWRGLVVVGLVLAAAGLAQALVFRAAEWRAVHVLLVRYCDDPEGHLARVREISGDQMQLDARGRRAYMIAAKLLFVLPRAKAEPIDDYLVRLRRRIAESCR